MNFFLTFFFFFLHTKLGYLGIILDTKLGYLGIIIEWVVGTHVPQGVCKYQFWFLLLQLG